MASTSRSGSSRRKPEAPGRIRLQFKGKSSKILHSDDEEGVETQSSEDIHEEDDLPAVDNGIPEDLPEGTIVVQPQAVEDCPVKKKRDPPIDTTILDNVSCTACGHQLNPYKGSALQKHPELKVVICKKCDKFLSSGEIAKDKDGTDEQCRWCGEGGRLVVCDEDGCASAFCRACVMRNFNRSEFTNINDQPKWKCYLCDKAPLQGLREKYRKIRDTLKALQAKEKAKSAATSNGTGRSQNSVGSKQQTSRGAASETASNVDSPGQQKVASKGGIMSTSISLNQKTNLESKKLSDNSKIISTAGEAITLDLKDLNVSYENVDQVMDNLSTATNTFKEMLRALRSQFHSTSPRALDEDPPKFQFSFSSKLDSGEKRRICAKALNMGLETYVKSLKSILSHSQSTGISAQNCSREHQDGLNSKGNSSKEFNSKSLNTSRSGCDSDKRANSEKKTHNEVAVNKLNTQNIKQKSKDGTSSEENSKARESSKRNKSPANLKAKDSNSDISEDSMSDIEENVKSKKKNSLTKDRTDESSESILELEKLVKSAGQNEPTISLVKINSKQSTGTISKQSSGTTHSKKAPQKSQEMDKTTDDQLDLGKDMVVPEDENLAAKNDLIRELDDEDGDDAESMTLGSKPDKEQESPPGETINSKQKELSKNTGASSSGEGDHAKNKGSKSSIEKKGNKVGSSDEDSSEFSESQSNTKLKRNSKEKLGTKKKSKSEKKVPEVSSSEVSEAESLTLDTKKKSKSEKKVPEVSSSEVSEAESLTLDTKKNPANKKLKLKASSKKASATKQKSRGGKNEKNDISSSDEGSDAETLKSDSKQNKNTESSLKNSKQNASSKKLISKQNINQGNNKNSEVLSEGESDAESLNLESQPNTDNESQTKKSSKKELAAGKKISDEKMDDAGASDEVGKAKSSVLKIKQTAGDKTSEQDTLPPDDVQETQSAENSKESPHSEETVSKSNKSQPKPVKKKSEVNGEEKDQHTATEDEVNGTNKTEDEVLDKEIDKLSKLPTLRKRKVKDITEEEESKDDSEIVEPKKKIIKLSKPGPKSSKKNTDYDDLSSDGEDKKESEHDTDDEDDGPNVTFFVEPLGEEDEENGGGGDDDENEMAKNGLLEDMDEDKEDNEHSLSDDDDSDSSKKPKDVEKKKKDTEKKKAKEESDEDSDSDGKIGGRRKKQVRNKLLDIKLSESDSDIEKPKKKAKKGSDDDFKDGNSSDSSIDSDVADDDDDDDKDDSEDSDNDDGDDSDTKKKKKGKKKSKRKRKGKGKKSSDKEDDGTEGTDDEDDDDDGKKKKKGKGRRRIKKMSDSSNEDEDKEEDDDEDEDDDDPNSSKAGKRKQIRKVMSNKKLEDSTRAAAKAEEKRRKRIAAKQREFNIETFNDENNPMNCPITTKLVLEAGKEEGDDPIVQVNTKLVRKLKPHQVEAIQFMWDCLFESVKRTKKESGAGCILAHCMGLGKTLSVIAFVHTIMTHEKVLKQKTCLVVSPLNTVLNWRNEWTLWLDEEDQLEVGYLISENIVINNCLKAFGYHHFILYVAVFLRLNQNGSQRDKYHRTYTQLPWSWLSSGPDIVICDEGHILKNEASAISKAMNKMRTRRRVVLTGTPLQNNLNEYHCMLSFVKPNLLGTRKEFTNRFVNPISNGQCTDSTPRDFKLMKARAHILHEMLAGCVQRRDYSALTKFLPPKQEYVISVRLTNIQIDLYEKYMELTGQGVDGVFSNKGARLFTDYQNLMKIWTHPWVLKLAEIRDESKMKYDDEDSFIDDDDSDEERSFSSTNSTSDEDKKEASDSGGEGPSARPPPGRGTKRTRAKARRLAGEDSDPEEVIAEWKSKTRGKAEPESEAGDDQDKAVTREWWAAYVTEDDKLKLEHGNKLFLLFEILRMCEEIGDKVLIFSQSILSLNIIENFLETIDSKFQQECESLPEDKIDEKEAFGKCWTKNLDYYRMDGTTSAQNRQTWASNFNDVDNYRARLFLISTRAGGLGINLVAANRVIIFDASWNPSHDVQSIFRVYRFGQTKPCYIYRFLAQGTMEEKIYERQVAKLSLSQRVVDEHQIERHFSANDLKELYNFKPDRWDDGTEKPTLALPKDPLLAEILQNNKHCVHSFHEHDSLLENQVDQNLTEEEKKAAWEEYENEKKGIIIRGPGMERTASWPMMAAAQILTREQITATVQALRQQLPDISEDLFHLHVQQALRRQVQMKQEELRRMELLKYQEMSYLNMIKQQAQQSGMNIQAMQNMAPWMQIQRLRALQNQMMMSGMGGMGAMGMHPSASMSLLGHPEMAERISNKPEEAIDLDDN
ncbi:unnamed protein product [Lymnaea stagnalis]|uniref:ATP-dependent helicase ATRX n=1 Tax=Lymnaea stagnalis TaxID=6523 RepID=A0AAV2HNS3_LYMST